MAKSCLDCVEKYEKTKQRKRNAKKRQKKKEQLANPAPIIRQIVLPPSQQYIPPTPQFKLPAQTQNDLTFFQRAQELDTLSKLLDKKQQRLDKESDDYYKKLAKANQQFESTPESKPKPKPSLERKPRPRTVNEAVSDSLDYFGGTLSVGGEAVKQTPSAIVAPAVVAGQFVGKTLKLPFQFLGSVASTIGGKLSSLAEPEPTLERGSAPARLERVERSPPAVGGSTPELRFIGGTGRILESSPVETGASPPASVFFSTTPSIADILRPRTRIIPEDEFGSEAGSRVIEQQRRMDNPFPLGPPEYQRMTHNLAEPAPLEVFAIGQPPVLLPEEDIFEDASGELPLEEAPPTIATSTSLVSGEPMLEEPLTAERLTTSPRTLERQTTEELARLVEDIDEDIDLSAVEKQKAYDEQKKEDDRQRKEEERLAKEDRQIAKIQDRQRREEAQAIIALEREQKRLERERAKAEKELKKRVVKPTSSQLQIPGLKRSDIANTPKLQSFFKPQAEEFQYARLAAASRSVPTSQISAAEDDPFTVEKLGMITIDDEEPLTFTQPSQPTFKFAEGGGI